MLNGYDRGLKFIFRHQLSALIATLLLMVATGYLYVKIPKGFFPQQDTGFIFGQAVARQDTSFPKMAGMLQQIVDIVQQGPGGLGRVLFRRRLFVQPDRKYRARLHAAEAA